MCHHLIERDRYLSCDEQGGVDSTQFKAKKTVFKESHKSEGGQVVQSTMDGWKCSTYQYLGSMQMKVTSHGYISTSLSIVVTILARAILRLRGNQV